ncbi:MAG TPA: tRNA pseudouridine(38-40) synthase TruA [Candidatus Lachnoclostridium pullistercoris]|uniref:tRNA pseudouridine synthase A n=1 Tax=Candidatus Lachnoclostridium pullistercoris TaxID=2838632 RepID=A0A9D2T6G6_9FIRM|nr:tRNA pseudouridine(38-40) synthase TruA [Candidatus Lachnoclostridium pullistercoris]
MRNIRVLLEYDGSRYDGWQKQGNTERTIQGRMEAVLERMTGHPTEVHGAGRTDAGVHAKGQTANFKVPEHFSAEETGEYLNLYLPEDIRVTEAEEVPERFHSRLNACGKLYRYRIWTGKKRPVFERKYLCGLGHDLDEQAMRRAAEYLVGTRDFKSFCGNRKMKKSTVRTLFSIDVRRDGEEIALDFYGDGFLYHMVRILAGTLIEVGEGKRTPESMTDILEAKDRQAAGFTAPPEGLCLMQVDYGAAGEERKHQAAGKQRWQA